MECPAEFSTTKFRQNYTYFFNSAGTRLRNLVKFRGIQFNTEFHRILIPSELFFDGIMDTKYNFHIFTSLGLKHWEFKNILMSMIQLLTIVADPVHFFFGPDPDPTYAYMPFSLWTNSILCYLVTWFKHLMTLIIKNNKIILPK